MMLSAAFATVACSDDYVDWANPQANDPEEPGSAVEVTIAPAEAFVESDNADTIRIATLLAEVQDNNTHFEGFELKSLTLFGNEVPGFLDGYTLCVHNADIRPVVTQHFQSRAAQPRELDFKFTYGVQFISGESALKVGEAKSSYTPMATPAIDVKGYAMLGQWQGWNPAEPTVMTQIDDHTFQASVITGEGDNWYKFYPMSAFDGEGNVNWDANLGCAVNGDNSLFNYVIWPGDYTGVETPVISGAGAWLITLDMLNMTFSVVVDRDNPYYKNTYLYVVGGVQGWNGDAASGKTCLFYPQNKTTFSYTTKWTGAWDLKFGEDNDFGNWDLAYGCPNDGDNSYSGELTNSGAGAISAPSAEYYTLTVDLGTNTYTWTKLDNQEPAEFSSVSLIGDFNGWTGDIDLRQVTPHNWYVPNAVVTDGGLKFRANHDWGTNWGAGISIADTYYGTGVNNGDNIYVPEGTYDVYLNDITGEFAFIAK